MRSRGTGGTTTSAVRIAQASPAEVTLLRRFADDVYDRAFHDKHREDADAWIGRLVRPGDGPQQQAILLLDDDEPVAGALTETYQDDLVLLTYAVVREDRRGLRLGSRLMREVRELHRGQHLTAEIVDPGCCPPDEREEAVRRGRVFDAWGWRMIVYPYHQPPLRPGEAWTSDLLLLHHGPDERIPRRVVDDLNEGLRSDLGAGDPPPDLTHRHPEQVGPDGTIPTAGLDALDVSGDGGTRRTA